MNSYCSAMRVSKIFIYIFLLFRHICEYISYKPLIFNFVDSRNIFAL